MTDRIAIIGLGPRGLGALEALAAAGGGLRRVDVFDPAATPGSGPNFDPGESELCLLNIPIRDIAIDPPTGAGLGPFAAFTAGPADPDAFPPRAEMGRYLEARYADLCRRGAIEITHHRLCVTGVSRADGGWMLTTEQGRSGPYGEVLITVGQPPTEPDPQWADWQRAARGAMADAYPARDLIARAAEWTGQTVAIRGLGLSSFDVLRCLTVAQGGRFEGGAYHASGREPARIVPFSLDGRPPFPKPATLALDAQFDPTEAETEAFVAAIDAAVAAPPDAAQRRITAALMPPVHRIVAAAGGAGSAEDVLSWIEAEWTAPGSPEDHLSPLDALERGLALAVGTAPPTIGYAVGQLWRKWQNQLRRGYNAADVAPETAQALDGFDEGLKRYSYGPPIAAAEELKALIDAGRVTLGLAADPEVGLTDSGWSLAVGRARAEASVMIDAVLPAPDITAVTGPLIAGLAGAGHLAPLAQGMGARTGADAVLIDAQGAPLPGLALLGRLALGRVIAVDSLHDCFGDSATRWAEGVVERAGNGRSGLKTAR